MRLSVMPLSVMRHGPIRLRPGLLALVLAAGLATPLAGCSVEEANRVQESRSSLVGMSRADLYLCAGFPSKREQVDATREMLTYEVGGGQGSGLNLTLPVVGALNLTGAAGYCRATFELVDAHVTRVGFSGDKDLPAAPDALCAPAIKACVDARNGTQPLGPAPVLPAPPEATPDAARR